MNCKITTGCNKTFLSFVKTSVFYLRIHINTISSSTCSAVNCRGEGAWLWLASDAHTRRKQHALMCTLNDWFLTVHWPTNAAAHCTVPVCLMAVHHWCNTNFFVNLALDVYVCRMKHACTLYIKHQKYRKQGWLPTVIWSTPTTCLAEVRYQKDY